jgi:anti-sigma regulatory factor (Ser/Thr protein kinase)
MMSATTWLPQETRSGGAARRFVSEQLRQWRYRGPYDDVLIVTTELVSNALRHARSAVVLQLSLDRACLRLQVGDDSEARPVRRAPDADGGYGLNIVNEVCTRWGVEHVAGGKIVWCECPTELAEPPVSLARSSR